MAETTTSNVQTRSLSGDINLPLVATIIITFTILVVVIVLLTIAGFRWAYAEERIAKSQNATTPELQEARTSQIYKLDTYRMVDENAGTVAIPIDRAIELMVAEARSADE